MIMKYAKKGILLSLLVWCSLAFTLFAQTGKKEFYELRIYHIRDHVQEARVDAYLKDAFLPTMHRAGIKSIGVFKPIETDTTFGKRIVVLIPYASADQFAKIPELITVDKKYNEDGSDYINAVYTDPPYARIETILLRAFKGMPRMQIPVFANPRSERIYELRSYEGATEKIYRNKVHMFNEGDEVGLFKRLSFNAVFYADVMAGSRMPNLMYMTTFANQSSHDEKWKAFTEDPQWKKLSSMPEYQHNVSSITIYLLSPTGYSDY
jgi:hypothetical protein